MGIYAGFVRPFSIDAMSTSCILERPSCGVALDPISFEATTANRYLVQKKNNCRKGDIGILATVPTMQQTNLLLLIVGAPRCRSINVCR